MKSDQAGPDLSQITKLLEERERAIYQRGWDDAIAAMTAAVGKAGIPNLTTKKAPARPKAKPKRKAKKRVLINRGPSKARAIVLEIIRQNPGRSGTEIAAMAADQVNKHTVRTQLRKLKRSGEAEQTTALRWYAKGEQKQAA